MFDRRTIGHGMCFGEGERKITHLSNLVEFSLSLFSLSSWNNPLRFNQ